MENDVWAGNVGTPRRQEKKRHHGLISPWCSCISYSWQTCTICIISFCLFGLVLERKKVILLPTDAFSFSRFGHYLYYCSVTSVFV